MEKQVALKEDEMVVRIVLDENLSEEWRKLQLEGQIVLIFLVKKIIIDHRRRKRWLRGLLRECTGLIGMFWFRMGFFTRNGWPQI